ncbi:TPA_asm: hypothetical protein G1S21_24500 [Salmonella enterica subsp. enterica serovar Typhi str. CT18]|uniref:Uncharacterized protein n=4 Tax=Salmonella enterica I TaxID=59201 RepID=A0A718JZ05_SALTS|nr:hypothetical protein [Salmonella enterica]ECB1387373.1 hypothetical protein [Salmonella enterica subsp. enterica serovar Typhi]ECM4679948.1 hypothetical protein [Salmonella enterica subsp. enterica serovar Dublin]EDL7208893.1 hypothetical protein [Salmonella enterica subsp. enterica serovar Typhimurium]HAD3731995.1 hypothetical protein [Salmonella enterica subsp. enterica serovar Typhi str. CT18]HAD6547634.1 hypothetical protein [Salmonella enterica subsp. enterica serovar Typhimurium str. 
MCIYLNLMILIKIIRGFISVEYLYHVYLILIFNDALRTARFFITMQPSFQNPASEDSEEQSL